MDAACNLDGIHLELEKGLQQRARLLDFRHRGPSYQNRQDAFSLRWPTYPEDILAEDSRKKARIRRPLMPASN
jgi:hypothetical protein